ncbi:hypothetical protein FEM48_Zijuj03G0055100 [Ziziphus jujuba var. spinosa]|uniref:Uncharacterized protein n=1 Tax=Ziziphus jujuba var. spinosa TaxID=714518 RepID=A0A978VNG5_ZIZJJ|nr:hypothetical protein FEM48_Zijuj03G0055100 [Ziziphus jujuba var. spinosa]
MLNQNDHKASSKTDHIHNTKLKCARAPLVVWSNRKKKLESHFKVVMELDQCSPFNWGFCYEEEGMEELRYGLLHTTLELETTILSAKEEITKREEELLHLKDLLCKAIRERNEAQSECQKLMFDNLILNQQLQKRQSHHDHAQHLKQPQEEVVFASLNEEDPKGSKSNQHYGTSDTTDENILIASPDIESAVLQPPLLSSPLPPAVMKLVEGKPLPEKGKLLQAVREAGPLLQTLLLAGPLPQWQHPPPRLDTIDIPPVAISPPPSRLLQHQESCISVNDCFGKKRSLSLCDGPDFCSNTTKYQKVVLD